jgi:transcriptional regulator with XRE-family HTH domain
MTLYVSKKSFGERLRATRFARRFTLELLAEVAEVPEALLRRFEAERTHNDDVDDVMLLSLARTLGVEPEWLGTGEIVREEPKIEPPRPPSLPIPDELIAIARATGVSPHWLATGELLDPTLVFRPWTMRYAGATADDVTACLFCDAEATTDVTFSFVDPLGRQVPEKPTATHVMTCDAHRDDARAILSVEPNRTSRAMREEHRRWVRGRQSRI